ncbi:MAG: hypothetical protein ACYSW7_08745 [Planctomycetota bacterium]|jgi:hypothetical protein
MGKCSDDNRGKARVKRGAKYLACGFTAGPENGPLTWFGKMIQNCYEYASDAKAKGKPIVGIMCEYTPAYQINVRLPHSEGKSIS